MNAASHAFHDPAEHAKAKREELEREAGLIRGSPFDARLRERKGPSEEELDTLGAPSIFCKGPRFNQAAVMGSYEPVSGQTGDQFISTLGSMLSGEGGKRGEGSATGGEGNAPEASGSGGQIGGCKNLGWELIGEIRGVKGLAKVWSVPWKLPTDNLHSRHSIRAL